MNSFWVMTNVHLKNVKKVIFLEFLIKLFEIQDLQLIAQKIFVRLVAITFNVIA